MKSYSTSKILPYEFIHREVSPAALIYALKKMVNLVSRVFSYSAPELEKNLGRR